MRQSEFFADVKDFPTLTVVDFMEAAVSTCEPSTNCRDAATTLIKIGCGSLPVVEHGNRLVGSISDFELLHTLKEGKILKDITVGEVMNKEVVTVTQDIKEQDLIEVLESNNLVRVPVVDGDALVGIVSRRDVLFGFIQATSPHWHF